MEWIKWTKFKALDQNGSWFFGNSFRQNPLGDFNMYSRTARGQRGVLIDPKTLCRFVTNIESVGDLYEGDAVMAMDENRIDSSWAEPATIFYNTRGHCWDVYFDNGMRSELVFITVTKIIGNIHDPK